MMIMMLDHGPYSPPPSPNFYSQEPGVAAFQMYGLGPWSSITYPPSEAGLHCALTVPSHIPRTHPPTPPRQLPRAM